MITNPVQAVDNPWLAVLSAVAHGADPNGRQVIAALLTGLQALDVADFADYYDSVLGALPKAALRHLEELMTAQPHVYQSEFVRRFVVQGRAEGRAEGKAEGKAEGRVEGEAEGKRKAVLTVLSARGIAVPNVARKRISTCTDLEQLDLWVRRAATADTVQDLFR